MKENISVEKITPMETQNVTQNNTEGEAKPKKNNVTIQTMTRKSEE